MTTTVNYGSKVLTLKQDAYLHNAGEYRADALGDDGLDYIVEWVTTGDWDAANVEAAANRAAGDYDNYPALLDDESNACVWDAPSNIRPA